MSADRKLQPEEQTLLRRAARELVPDTVVNLGIGLPTFIPRFIPADMDIVLHSENGFVGMGAPREEPDPDHPVIDAGGRACDVVAGASFFDSTLSFTIVRGGHLDLAVLGAFEVSLAGDLANWKIPGKLTPGMGGGMELAQKARRVLVVCRHLDKRGRTKIVSECDLPLTAPRCVSTVITERGVYRRHEGRLRLCSVHPRHTVRTALEGMPEGLEVAETLEPWSP